jgi:hypothetical protein
MLTSMLTGPLALELVREANVVGTWAFAGLVVTGFVAGDFATEGTGVAAGGAVVADVATGAAVAAGADVAGTVVTGAAVAGALVGGAVAAVVAGDVGAGVVGIVGKTSVGAGVSCALETSTVPASSAALTKSTPNRDFLTRCVLLGTNRGEVFTT